MTEWQARYRPLPEAIAFAARAHRHQLRKDHQTPYVSHVFRVCLVARQVFGIDDPRVLATAVLHDTIEDTNTDFDDLREQFGEEIAGWVAALSKDKRQIDEHREKEYMAVLARAPWQVQVCKLADVFDNLMDSAFTDPRQRQKSLSRSRGYLEALRPTLPPEAQAPFEIVYQFLTDLERSPLPCPAAPAQ